MTRMCIVKTKILKTYFLLSNIWLLTKCFSSSIETETIYKITLKIKVEFTKLI